MASTAINPNTVDGDTFVDKVSAGGLKTYEAGGYVWARGAGAEKDVLYRTPANGCVRRFWAYTCRFTETNVAGGNNTVTITPATGTAMRLISMRLQMADTAAGRSATINLRNEDAVRAAFLTSTVSIDNQGITIPTIGAVPAADHVVLSGGMVVPGDGSYVEAYAAALAQNEYFDLIMYWELLGTDTAPAVAHTSSGTASTGTPSQNDVTEVVLI